MAGFGLLAQRLTYLDNSSKQPIMQEGLVEQIQQTLFGDIKPLSKQTIWLPVVVAESNLLSSWLKLINQYINCQGDPRVRILPNKNTNIGN